MSTMARTWEYLCTRSGELLFPAYCMGCHAPHTLLCTTCASALYSPPTKCLLCARPVLGGICKDCSVRTRIDRIDAYAPYKQPLARMLVGNMKYHYEHALARPMGNLLATLLATIPNESLLVPIPLHPKKLRERGFNQSFLIASSIAEVTHIPIAAANALVRARYTSPQARTASRAERKTHLKSAFALKHTETFTNKHIILVDDVVTSGTTVREVARTLSATTPASIRVVAFAYG